MSVFIPIDNNITEFGDLVSVELFSTIAGDINYLLQSMPKGSIIPIITNIPGIPTPDPTVWQECNGEVITDSISPLRNYPAPNFTDLGRYLKHYQTFGTIGSYAGENIRDFTHTHGAQTDFNTGYATDADSDNDYWTGKDHQHSISADLGIIPFEPEHIRIKHYIKINDTGVANTGVFKDMEIDFGTTVAQALWQKASRGINQLDKCYPVGMVLFFYATQDLLPSLPDPQYWQLLNGSTVNNVNSPLDGQVLPDVTGRFIRHPLPLETELSLGGSNTEDLSHNHGGSTGVADDRNDFELDNGQERSQAGSHSHSISTDLGITSTVPLYVELQCYIRIV